MNNRNNPSHDFINPFEAAVLLRRLIANLRGFAYRRSNDRAWSMEWVSKGFRDVTGYDPHRFFKNQSLSFADLILPQDRPVVTELIDRALASRRRTVATYRIMAAHQAVVTVEDRLIGVYDGFGQLVAVEGIVDYAPNGSHARPAPSPAETATPSLNPLFFRPFALPS